MVIILLLLLGSRKLGAAQLMMSRYMQSMCCRPTRWGNADVQRCETNFKGDAEAQSLIEQLC